MWVKSLMLREIRQARAMIWIIPLGHFLMLGLQRYNEWFMGGEDLIALRVRFANSMLEAYQYGNMESNSRMMLVLALFVLALIQIGAERRNGAQELLFSFPYSRRSIYVTKWLFGVGLLAGSLLLNTLIDMAVMASSPVSSYFSFAFHANEFLYSMLTVTALYTLALFLGAISGSIASQGIFSGLVFVLPLGLWVLIERFLRVHDIYLSNGRYYSYRDQYQFYRYFSPDYYLFVQYPFLSAKYVIGMAALLLLAGWGGMAAYEKNRAENNGKLLLFPVWDRILQVSFVACFSLFSALFVSEMLSMSNELIWYYAGLLAGAFIGLSLIRRLTRIRLKI
ncbi:ABC-2 transporter permease [Cohnella luojiensis]|uniref:ABC transporter permease n=1 Tax=Cohnella luojiensis TaxID=652876 RepID=A0A4Y8LR99_9BACL|nr:ABC-2 transporter permease [Cohnella luojiensis]TFE19839.1 hypothetical protein E2980_21860 [Cohnella luojiensis]